VLHGGAAKAVRGRKQRRRIGGDDGARTRDLQRDRFAFKPRQIIDLPVVFSGLRVSRSDTDRHKMPQNDTFSSRLLHAPFCHQNVFTLRSRTDLSSFANSILSGEATRTRLPTGQVANVQSTANSEGVAPSADSSRANEMHNQNVFTHRFSAPPSGGYSVSGLMGYAGSRIQQTVESS
jgi:hypothetical protein